MVVRIFIICFLFCAGNVWGNEEPFKYDAHGKRDPMWALVSPSGTVVNYESDLLFSDLSLEGIMAGDAGRSLAIINGKVVTLNDKIGQFVIHHIDPNFVILRKGQEEFTLELKKEE
jgi:type II secretory pathway component PulC